jgi:hypothetical protein
MRSFELRIFVAILMLCAIALAGAGSAKTHFRGEISDTQCAMKVHSLERSHAEMIAKSTLGTDAASCAKACVKRGGEWVLRSGEVVYRLKKQEGMENFAGQKVEVTGTLDSEAGIIDNTAIETQPEKPAGHR